ncbi:hypothetical protein [Hymenobacter metallicola]|uniref:hypothetical protein n=1 Tax=Hymenobacter metallicola TaxID=2563114 RepID=UPI001436C7C1|nr:hypothetical protein [Hymenobacter metallicola]
MSAITKIKARLRTEHTEGLPRLLRLYAADSEALRLITAEINHRQQLANIKAKVQRYRP